MEAIFKAADDGKVRLMTSMIAVTEVAFAESERKQKALDPEVQAKIDKLWHPASPIRLVEVHELVIRRARDLLRFGASNGWSGTGANDAIHLATAEREGAQYLFSYDSKMSRWSEKSGLQISEPHLKMVQNEPPNDPSLFAEQ